MYTYHICTYPSSPLALGVVEFDLSSFADPEQGGAAPSEHTFPLTKSFINGAYLQATIFPKVMSTDSNVQDDTMSMQSGFSDAPVMSADFGLTSLPKYPTSTSTPAPSFSSPEKVVEEDEEDEEGYDDEEVALELHKKTIELTNLEEDNAELRADSLQQRDELAAAQRALTQLTAHVQQQLKERVAETESARASRITLTRILAGTSLSTDADTIANLKKETAALFAEVEAQTQVLAAYTHSAQVKETRLTEAEERNLYLLGKVTQLAERNAALKTLVENSIPKEEHELRLRRKENVHERQIVKLKSAKKHELDNAEKELERQEEINHDLKRRLQLYSENVAELEVNGVANAGQFTHKKNALGDESPTKRRTSQVDTMDEVKTVTYEGSLTKRGSFYPSWKKRHFILHGDSDLSYYTNQDDMVFKGHFIITSATVLGEATVSGYKCFYLEHSKRRLYMTAATTLEEMEWMAVFRRSISALGSVSGDNNHSNSNNKR